MEWVEVEAKTVDAAVAAALQELGLSSADEASVEVIQEPEKGFLGFGGTEAIVRVKPAPKAAASGRRSRRGRGQGQGRGRQGGGDRKKSGGKEANSGQDRNRGRSQGGDSAGGAAKGGNGRRAGAKNAGRQDRPANNDGKSEPQAKGNNRGRDNQRNGKPGDKRDSRKRSQPSVESTQEVDVAEQAEILKSFMVGLIDAYGLEGETTTRIEDDIIFIDVSGEQTEALVGNRGVILQSILDLMKIVVQRKTHHRARIRLDIAGYSERRREALGIYSRRLSEQVLSDGEEVMLEPMHPGDRKVVHDAVAEIEGVRSWSEGEEPQRSVIIGLAPGTLPTASSDDEE